MSETPRTETENKLIERFTKIKNIADAGIAFLNKKDKSEDAEEPDIFALTEQIQEEIEEIRDLLFE